MAQRSESYMGKPKVPYPLKRLSRQVAAGAVPNEYGTWFFGRNGWCNGRDVTPQSWDVSDELLPPGGTNVLRYRSLLRGEEYDGVSDVDGAAELLMSSYLVFYASGAA
eukprot:366459-Chlamydomonas_euryale.AAC.2